MTRIEESVVQYTSGICTSCQAFLRHIQSMVGNIPTMDIPEQWDIMEPRDIVVASDGLVVFGIGYHSWVVSTKDKQILLSGGGPDDGNPLLMTPYRS
jgi:hypothetical protein